MDILESSRVLISHSPTRFYFRCPGLSPKPSNRVDGLEESHTIDAWRLAEEEKLRPPLEIISFRDPIACAPLRAPSLDPNPQRQRQQDTRSPTRRTDPPGKLTSMVRLSCSSMVDVHALSTDSDSMIAVATPTVPPIFYSHGYPEPMSPSCESNTLVLPCLYLELVFPSTNTRFPSSSAPQPHVDTNPIQATSRNRSLPLGRVKARFELKDSPTISFRLGRSK